MRPILQIWHLDPKKPTFTFCISPVRKSAFILFFIVLAVQSIHAGNTYRVRILKEEFVFTQPPFKQCHAPTLIETSGGRLIAACFGGDHEGSPDVCIWSSRLENGQWQAPVQLSCGNTSTGISNPCWNPVFFKPSDSSLFLYYKTGRSPREWDGQSIVSKDEGKSWSSPVALKEILGPAKNKPLITNGGAWLLPSSKETPDRWQVFIERSADHGMSWNIIPVDTSNKAKVIQPALLTDAEGRIHALCRSDQDCIMESISSDEGKTWGPLIRTSLPNPNSGFDALTLNTGIHMVVYNPGKKGKDWWNGRNKLIIAVSSDTKTWTDIYTLEDKAEGEFSYPALIQTKDGVIHILYTYNRVNIRHVALKLENE